MKASAACFDLIKASESLRLFAYPDPASELSRATPELRKRWGFEPAQPLIDALPESKRFLSGHPWTIGYGHVAGVKPTDVITEHQADILVEHDSEDAQASVNQLVLVPLTQGMFDALVDFVFNMGRQKFLNSTLLRQLNARDYVGAKKQFERWVFAGAKFMEGLKTRRIAEMKLFGDAPYDFSNVESGVETTAPTG